MNVSLLRAFGPSSCLTLEQVPTPEPAADEVLIRIQAAGLNRLDHYLREGSVTRDLPLPRILGSDGAGVVERAPAGSDLKPGDRVIHMPGYPLDPAHAGVRPISAAPSYGIVGMLRDGTYAQFIAVPRRWVVRDQTGLPPHQAATLPMPIVTGVRAVRVVGEVREGQSVLVHAGASGTGSINIQVAKALGARVAATVRSASKVEFVRSLGAEEVFVTNGTDFVQPTLRWTDGRGADVIIDNLGGPVLTASVDALRPLGILVSMGMVMGLEATISLRSLFFAQKQIRGTLMGDFEDLTWGLDQVRAGRIRPTLDRVYPLSRAAEAHERLARGDSLGTIVLDPWAE